MQERSIVLLDYANINRAASTLGGGPIDYARLLNYLSDRRFLVDAHAYVPIDPRSEHRMDRTIEDLWLAGYMVHSKVGTIRDDGYRCDFDVEMAVDALRIAREVRPDILVLCTGDAHCLPIVTELRRMGIRVETASFRRSASREMMLKSSGFINLDEFLLGEQASDIPDFVEMEETDTAFETTRMDDNLN